MTDFINQVPQHQNDVFDQIEENDEENLILSEPADTARNEEFEFDTTEESEVNVNTPSIPKPVAQPALFCF